MFDEAVVDPESSAPLLPGLSVVMSAYNEAPVLEDCLRSVDGLADEVVVVDCTSQDGSGAVAAAMGARVLEAPNRLMLNINKNIAIGQARHRWTLLLDPDERLSPELKAEIRGVVTADQASADAYTMPRLNHELGLAMRSMGHYPDRQLRLFRTGTAHFECKHIHEWVVVTGTAGQLQSDLLHFPKPSLYDYVQKRNLYSDHRAAQMLVEGRRFRLHRLLSRPVWHFVKNFALRGGWREGTAGFIVAVTGSFGTFLQDAKLWQLSRGLVPAPNLDGPCDASGTNSDD